MFARTSTAGSSNSDAHHPAHLVFDRAARCVRRRGSACPGRRRSGDGAGSAPSSSLPWSVSGRASSPTNVRRDHVVGQPCGEDVRAAPPWWVTQRRPRARRTRRARARRRASAAGHHGAGRHATGAVERSDDLRGLDPEAAELDLPVQPAEEGDLAVRPAAGPGRRCGTPAAAARRPVQRDEAGGGQLRVVAVAAADQRRRRGTARPARPAATGCSDAVEDQRGGVGDRPADGRGAVALSRGRPCPRSRRPCTRSARSC